VAAGDPVCSACFLSCPVLELHCADSPDCGGMLEYEFVAHEARPMRPMYGMLYSHPPRVGP
jgi:hypothetical protein